ncbi:efflux RND transporter permease subunit [Dokdonia sp.]|uniref:efflux RND transporter permease subunit n=1 Tax=Dokdonia sp. TaxID=2024995 RepID=UPI003264E957
MIRFLLQRPVAVFMASLAFLLLGTVAIFKIPTALMPDIPIPKITIQVSYPNNTARELETNVIRPLRNQLLQISRLKDISSEARDGSGTITLVFDYGVNTDFAFIETNEKVDATLNFLPRNLERPKVIKAATSDIPIINLTVGLKEPYTDERFLQLSEFTETVLKKRIEQLPDIALADMSGQIEGELIITPNRDAIISLNITNELITNTIRQNNFELGNLIIQNGIYQYNFKFSNPLRTQKDIEDIYITVSGRLFQLKDIAKVKLQPRKQRGSVFLNGERVLVLSIIKQADAKVYKLQEDLEALTKSLTTDYPDLVFHTNQDQTKLLKVSIDNLKSSLWIGSSLAILMMFFFLRDFKSPIIIGLSIPLSLIISVLLMYVFGLSINIISLSGLILGVGMMIDNAIIVIDNITQKIKAGFSLFDACTHGTNEIITPLISSVLTTCSVFIPLLFLSGITGALFYDQALAVSIGLVSSLLVSILIIPVIYLRLHTKKYKIENWFRGSLKTQQLEILYERGYYFFFKQKWIVYTIAGLGTGLAILFLNILPYSQLPDLDQRETILTIDWNDNITLKENKRRIQDIVISTQGIINHYSLIGEQQFLLQREQIKGFSEADVYIEAATSSDLIHIQHTITNSIKSKYAFAKAYFSPPKTIFEYTFGSDQTALKAHVYAKNGLEVPLVEELPEIDQLFDTKTSSKVSLKETIIIQVLFENIALYNINYQSLINELKTALGEYVIDDLKTAQKFIPIKLSYNPVDLEKILASLFVENVDKELIPVKNVIKIQNIAQYKSIQADRSGEFLPYTLDTQNAIDDEVDLLYNQFRTSPYNIRFSGNWFDIKTLSKELYIVIFIAVLLLYFIMAAQFESLWQPFIILLEIPIDIGGALCMLWLFGGTINIMAAIGIVVMSGIIINDSILKLHTINLLRKEGYTVDEAIKRGGTMRFKPILMTSLTTILALFPFLFLQSLGSILQRPLALTVIGGMLIGTFISLYFIPLLYSFLTRIFDR